MKFAWMRRDSHIGQVGSIFVPILLFGILLNLKIPNEYLRALGNYSFVFSILVFAIYYLAYRLPGRYKILIGFGFTLLLCSLTLLHRWSSGFSDNFIIGGLLPYKDAKNFYAGANLLLNGFPLENAGQATERPLFPGFLSSLLLLTNQNLQVSLALLALLAGFGLYFSSLRILESFGPLSASLYSTLLFFYAQSWLGYTMSELYGFIVGCFAFSLLWHAAHNFSRFDFALGSLALLVAISARPGAFLLFPLLALWAGWVKRGEKRFSIKAGVVTLFLMMIGYFVVNSIYGKLIGVPSGSAFSNFAYALYGQVRGGTGWHSAIEELGTRDPVIVYRAAYQFFLAHPLSLLLAFAKSYRDFFFPGYPNIFPFDVYGQSMWLTYTIWAVIMALLFLGLFRLIKNIRGNTASFLLAGFVGMLLSIPFLPPIDGGARFHASTVPFFFVLPAIGLSKATDWEGGASTGELSSLAFRYTSGVLIFLTLILPVLTYSLSGRTPTDAFSCRTNQHAYEIRVNPGSYINLIQDGNTYCGVAPDICLTDFLENNSEFAVDDFYQEIYAMMTARGTNVSLIPAINLVDKSFRYFYVDETQNLREIAKSTISGCALEVQTRNQSIYIPESISAK